MNRCSNYRPGRSVPPGTTGCMQFCLQGSCLTFSLVRLLVDPPRPAPTCPVCLPLLDPRGCIHAFNTSLHLHPSLQPLTALANLLPHSSSSLISRPILFVTAPKPGNSNISPPTLYTRLFLATSTAKRDIFQQTLSSRPWPAPVRLLRPLNRGHQCEESLPRHAVQVKLLLHCKLHALRTGLLDFWPVGN